MAVRKSPRLAKLYIKAVGDRVRTSPVRPVISASKSVSGKTRAVASPRILLGLFRINFGSHEDECRRYDEERGSAFHIGWRYRAFPYLRQCLGTMRTQYAGLAYSEESFRLIHTTVKDQIGSPFDLLPDYTRIVFIDELKRFSFIQTYLPGSIEPSQLKEAKKWFASRYHARSRGLRLTTDMIDFFESNEVYPVVMDRQRVRNQMMGLLRHLSLYSDGMDFEEVIVAARDIVKQVEASLAL